MSRKRGAEPAIELTDDDLRAVVRYAAQAADDVLPLHEAQSPQDRRPRQALEAAWGFADGAPRTNLQRFAAFAAHRAGKEAGATPAGHAAYSAGDAAAAAYLHPLPDSRQVGHILRAAAHAALAVELAGGGDTAAGRAAVESARRRAPQRVVDVLMRYPPAPTGSTRVARLMKDLDTALRRP